MATIAPLKPTNAGLTPAAFTASTPAGDVVTYPGSGSLLIEIDNGHSSSVTVTVPAKQTVGRVAGAGSVTIPARTLAVPAGAQAAFLFQSGEIAAYLDAGTIPLTYASGNAALLVRAVHIQ